VSRDEKGRVAAKHRTSKSGTRLHELTRATGG
jgi:hypothetical protein